MCCLEQHQLKCNTTDIHSSYCTPSTKFLGTEQALVARAGESPGLHRHTHPCWQQEHLRASISIWALRQTSSTGLHQPNEQEGNCLWATRTSTFLLCNCLGSGFLMWEMISERKYMYKYTHTSNEVGAGFGAAHCTIRLREDAHSPADTTRVR